VVASACTTKTSWTSTRGSASAPACWCNSEPRYLPESFDTSITSARARLSSSSAIRASLNSRSALAAWYSEFPARLASWQAQGGHPRARSVNRRPEPSSLEPAPDSLLASCQTAHGAPLRGIVALPRLTQEEALLAPPVRRVLCPTAHGAGLSWCPAPVQRLQPRAGLVFEKALLSSRAWCYAVKYSAKTAKLGI
jgi:hypothetical protein